MGLKRQKVSWSLLTRHLYTRQLAAVLSIEVLHPEACRLLLLLCLYTRTMLKVHGNLNKGASESMKVN